MDFKSIAKGAGKFVLGIGFTGISAFGVFCGIKSCSDSVDDMFESFNEDLDDEDLDEMIDNIINEEEE